MRFYLKTKNSVKGKTLVLHSVLKKVGNAIKKNCSQSKNVFQNRPLAGGFSFRFATGSIFFTFIFYLFFYLF